MATNSMECSSGDVEIDLSEKPHSGENCKQLTDTTTCQLKPVEEMLAAEKPTEPIEPMDIDIDEDKGIAAACLACHVLFVCLKN